MIDCCKKISVLLCAAAVLMWSAVGTVQAQSVIRDTEIENFLHDLSAPIFRAAEIEPGRIKFYIIADTGINAFVTGSDAIFMHTGLILETDSPEAVASVIAHELGHILAGHVSQTLQNYQQATRIALGTALAALTVGLASGNIEAAIAGSLGGADTAQKGLLRNSRLRETAADQIAVDLLNRAEISTRYMEEFLLLMKKREQGASYDKYLLTHPLSKDRLNFVRHNTEQLPYKDKLERPGLKAVHQRLKLKIIAHTLSTAEVMRLYSSSSDRDRYAQAIAHYRSSNRDLAVKNIDALIAKFPQDAYLYEIKGDIHKKFLDHDEAIAAYRQALKILKRAPLIEYALAEALTDKTLRKAESGQALTPKDERMLKQAQTHAYRVLNQDKDIVFSWKLLARIHDWKQEPGRRDLALAEHAYRRGDLGNAEKFARASKNHSDLEQSVALRVDDILLHIGNIKRQRQQNQ